MRKIIDEIDNIYGRLVVVKQEEYPAKNGAILWKCLCICGNFTKVQGAHLRNGKVRSCGCLRREDITKRSTTHGLAKSDEYKVWCDIKARCFDTNNKEYKNYGLRGITICNAWLNSFENFIADMGNKPTKAHQIDRINTNAGYSAGNCRWVTSLINGQNKRNSSYYYINGYRYNSPSHAAQILGVAKSTIQRWCKGRMFQGMFEPPKENCYAELKYQ
jgi:hypothetical protein